LFFVWYSQAPHLLDGPYASSSQLTKKSSSVILVFGNKHRNTLEDKTNDKRF
jgi:hypothetical protein